MVYKSKVFMMEVIRNFTNYKEKIVIDGYIVLLGEFVCGKKNQEILCFEEGSESIIWSLSSVINSKWWQENDSFVGITDCFYVRSHDVLNGFGVGEVFKKSGYIRAITFFGFSYEISLKDGSVEYFDFHK